MWYGPRKRHFTPHFSGPWLQKVRHFCVIILCPYMKDKSYQNWKFRRWKLTFLSFFRLVCYWSNCGYILLIAITVLYYSWFQCIFILIARFLSAARWYNLSLLSCTVQPMKLKKLHRKSWWTISRHDHNIVLEGLNESMENLSQERWYCSQHLKQASPRHKSQQFNISFLFVCYISSWIQFTVLHSWILLHCVDLHFGVFFPSSVAKIVFTTDATFNCFQGTAQTWFFRPNFKMSTILSIQFE
jgi:hypothetical protein